MNQTPRHADMMIKVCGMRNPENIARTASLMPMLMGFVFHPASPRDASGLDPEVVRSLPAFVRPVAVTVDMDPTELLSLCRRYGIKIVQLHGSESPELCKALKKDGLTVFKAFNLSGKDALKRAADYTGAVDLFIFDSGTGGTGEKFDWSVLEDYKLSTPYLLSGGIGPDDVDAVVAAMRPGMAGIDINSRFESEPGMKDLNLLINFILKLRLFNECEPTSTPFWEKEG